MKKPFILSIFVLSLIFVPRLSIAGAESHGGGAFVCRDGNGKIKTDPLSVELLDLWEAEAIFKHHVVRTHTPWDVQAKEAIEKLRQWDAVLASESALYLGLPLWSEEDVQRELAAIKSGVPYKRLEVIDINDPRAGGNGVGIATPNDTRAGYTKKGCVLEGAATFSDIKNAVIVDSEIVSKMGPTDYAALRVHEAVYRALRSLKGVKDSLFARAITGLLFSREFGLGGSVAGIPPEAQFCESKDGEYAFSLFLREEKIVLQFKVIHGLPVFGTSYTAYFSTSGTLVPDTANRIKAAMEDIRQGKNPTFFIVPQDDRQRRDDCASSIRPSAYDKLYPWNANDDRICLVASTSALSSAFNCH